jgi:hypothetical protein
MTWNESPASKELTEKTQAKRLVCLQAEVATMWSLLREFLTDQEQLKEPWRNEALCEKARKVLSDLSKQYPIP